MNLATLYIIYFGIGCLALGILWGRWEMRRAIQRAQRQADKFMAEARLARLRRKARDL